MKIKLTDLEFEIAGVVSKDDVRKETMKQLREMTDSIIGILDKRSNSYNRKSKLEPQQKGYRAAIIDLKILYSEMLKE
uniref:Uncharacterized protein n=1 Tax=viral metagenome TaxID=1070528 RepID=A0A6M3L8V6_9ZZZZ